VGTTGPAYLPNSVVLAAPVVSPGPVVDPVVLAVPILLADRPMPSLGEVVALLAPTVVLVEPPEFAALVVGLVAFDTLDTLLSFVVLFTSVVSFVFVELSFSGSRLRSRWTVRSLLWFKPFEVDLSLSGEVALPSAVPTTWPVFSEKN
jgi:hypothetical protein